METGDDLRVLNEVDLDFWRRSEGGPPPLRRYDATRLPEVRRIAGVAEIARGSDPLGAVRWEGSLYRSSERPRRRARGGQDVMRLPSGRRDAGESTNADEASPTRGSDRPPAKATTVLTRLEPLLAPSPRQARGSSDGGRAKTAAALPDAV